MTNIFEMGWFNNHQLDILYLKFSVIKVVVNVGVFVTCVFVHGHPLLPVPGFKFKKVGKQWLQQRRCDMRSTNLKVSIKVSI